MEERIREVIQKALEELGAPEVSFAVERPAEMGHGDYATNAAMAAAKSLGRNPRELAEEIAEALRSSTLLGPTSIAAIEVAGPGFVNITLAPDAVEEIIGEAKEEGWGRAFAKHPSGYPEAGATAGEGRKVMIEYTDPNPFKEMHIGHLMSNVIGESIARLIENDGATIARASYQGDVGPHVAKALWGLRKKNILEPGNAKELGDAYAHGSRAYEESTEAKAEIDALNVAIYEGKDAELMELWRKGRAVSLEAFERLYQLLGTKFDYYFFESETATPGLEMVRDGLKSGVFEESEGAIIYRGEKKGLHTLVFITSKGTPTYEAKDVGLAFLKEERWPSDESLILTAAEQTGHFQVFLAALADIAPNLAKKTTHIPHGFLRLTTGKMSSREGNVITAEELIKDVVARASEKNADPIIAGQVAMGAIKYMILRQSPGQDIIFDPEKSLSLEGDSGPYLQYAYVRAAKILAYAENGAGGTDAPPEPYDIERVIIHYPEMVARAARDRGPQLLVQYLTELAGAWNSFYAREQVLGSPEEQYKQRVARAFANTMKSGLTLLGIPVPERM